MDYIFYNHYYVEQTIDSMITLSSHKTILLAEPELEARGLYEKHLVGPDIEVYVCQDQNKLHENLADINPDLLIINPGTNPARSLVFLQSIKKNHPYLKIITIGYGTPDDYLDRFMQIGVSYHINRHLTRPQDVAVAAQQVLEEVYSLNI